MTTSPVKAGNDRDNRILFDSTAGEYVAPAALGIKNLHASPWEDVTQACGGGEQRSVTLEHIVLNSEMRYILVSGVAVTTAAGKSVAMNAKEAISGEGAGADCFT